MFCARGLCYWSFWYSRIESNLPRTNNSVEAWHHVFQKSLGCYHPTVNKLIAQFLKEQDQAEIEIARIRAGIIPPLSSKSKYAKQDRQMKAIAESFNQVSLSEYLTNFGNFLSI